MKLEANKILKFSENLVPRDARLFGRFKGAIEMGKTTILNGINPAELRLTNLKEDIFTPTIGKHKIPRFLYHLTSEEKYLEMLKNGYLKMGGGGDVDPIEGVFMIELNNSFKHWGKKLMGMDSNKELIKYVGKKGKIVALRIPTAVLDKNDLLIRSQNKVTEFYKTKEFREALENWKKTKEIPEGAYEHMFKGEKATKSRHYKQRKEIIEYIYPHEIKMSNTHKLGCANVNVNQGIDTKSVYTKLFTGYPEEQTLVLIKDKPTKPIDFGETSTQIVSEHEIPQHIKDALENGLRA